MNTLNASLKGYIMQSLASTGKQRIVVHALTIEDAKQLAYATHGIEFYFKGYQS